MVYVIIDRGVENSMLSRVKAVGKSIRVALEQRRVFDRTVYELRQLSDRDLWDLGISRSMITDIAREAAYGK